MAFAIIVALLLAGTVSAATPAAATPAAYTTKAAGLASSAEPRVATVQRQQPVHHPVHHPTALPPASTPLFLTASRVGEPAGVVGASVHAPGLDAGAADAPRLAGGVGRGSGRGTFAPRDQLAGAGGPRALPAGRAAHDNPAAFSATGRPTAAGDGPGPDTVEAATPTGPYVGRRIAPHLVPEDPTPRSPEPSGLLADAARGTRGSEPNGLLEGRVLAGGEPAGPPVVDESNLTYDHAGRRVFVVFTPAGNPSIRVTAHQPREGSTVEP